jgi:hypothetical protein
MSDYSKAYKIYNTSIKKISISRDIIFRKLNFRHEVMMVLKKIF